ncbi:Hypp1243 [Branchiostoma lanceolatum]|uniref:Hypp1243 protein n=1 Tax=Branchiostoma lanceolatum TaxID=7740 RepID=A0A8K0EJK6_BRALA|nr:Hypp1243 [Branchiostoma lanceolatum]
MTAAVPASANPGAAAAPPDSKLDMAVGGPLPATPDDHFYMHLVYPDPQDDGVTNPAATTGDGGASPGRQTDTVYEDVNETRQQRGGSVEDHVYQNY